MGIHYIEMYEHPRFEGRVVPLTDSVPDLSVINFDVKSYKVISGKWVLWSMPNFQGSRSNVDSNSSYESNQMKIMWVPALPEAPMRLFSSVMPLKGQIVLYDKIDFKGHYRLLTGSVPQLSSHNFNDRASSARIISGTWELYSNYYYGGACFTTSSSANEHSPIPELPGNSLSSVKLIEA